MTRGNRILATLLVLGLLSVGFGGTAWAADSKTFTIGGFAVVGGVEMVGLPGKVVTDKNGAYSARVPRGWSGRVTPTKPGYVFEPYAREYEPISESFTRENYTARMGPRVISGTVGVPGVKFKSPSGEFVSDDQGKFSVEVPSDLNGYVMPIKEGYTFDPPFVAFGPTSRIDTVHFTPRPLTVTISDVIKAGNEPIQGVTVSAQPGGYTAVTDAQGRYSLRVPRGWSGSLTFSKPGFDFVGGREYRNVTADITDGKSVPAEDEWPPEPSGGSRGGVSISAGNVLVIPTGDTSAEKIAETTEDLRVMLQILREKLSEPRMIRGVLRDYGSLLGDDRRAEAIYLQGSAALFVIGSDFPPSSPAQQPGQGEPPSRSQGEAADPVWQRTRQRLYSPGARTPSPSGQTQTMTFEQFQEELLRSLRHAANIRHIDPNELVVLTLVAQNEGASRAVDADMMRQYREIYGSDYAAMLGLGGPARSATVLTMQAKKADIDAFAQGALDFDQFRRKVKSIAY